MVAWEGKSYSQLNVAIQYKKVVHYIKSYLQKVAANIKAI